MGRDKSTAQPNRKLSEDEWEALRQEIETVKNVSVDALCGRKGVTRQRFYRKFPGGKRPEAAA